MYYLYPKTQQVDNILIPYENKKSKFDDSLKKISKIMKIEPTIIHQTECYYRDLVKIIIVENEKTETYYVKKKTFMIYDNDLNELWIHYDVQEIPNINFPIINDYHHTETKKIYKFNNVLIIEYDNFFTLCIECKEKTENIIKLMEKIKKILFN